MAEPHTVKITTAVAIVKQNRNTKMEDMASTGNAITSRAMTNVVPDTVMMAVRVACTRTMWCAEVLVEVEEVAAVVATADRNQKIVMLILALNISGRWIFEALGYWMRCASSLLVCNIIPKYPILVIDSSHDLKVNRCGSVHIQLSTCA
jgi:hypothetical protein